MRRCTWVWVALMPLAAGCGSEGQAELSAPQTAACSSKADCPAGHECLDGACVAPDAGSADAAAKDATAADAAHDSHAADVADEPNDSDASADASDDAAVEDAPFEAEADAGADSSADGSAGEDAAEDASEDASEEPDVCTGLVCGSACCDPGQRCAYDTCVPDLGTCTTTADCLHDAYCESGHCIPYGVPSWHVSDPDCSLPVDIHSVVPQVQCRWEGPPDGDAHPAHYQVMATPVVVDFDFDSSNDTLSPSIVFTSFPTSGSYHSAGVLRVIDGATCEQQFSFDDAADATMSPASVAVGDLDGDGRAEIVAAAHAGGLLAFRFDPDTQSFSRLWRSQWCSGASAGTPDSTGGTDKWAGPSIHDLDNDGVPEIIYGGVIYGADGCIRSNTLGYPGYHKGVVPVVADVDDDQQPELIFGNGICTWDATAGDMVPEPYFTGTGLSHGQVAVADMGDYPLASLGDRDMAEVVVISSGRVRVQTIEGTVVFGPYTIPGGGVGGAPTIADFDGDGRREFATAGGTRYVVFDLDCVAGGNPANCNGNEQTNGILWMQPSQDGSSNTTGSSVFDFDFDGRAEAVYADECFLRIYDGATGTVLFSAARSSGTTYENPVMADVDGDYHTEIVSAVNDYAGTLSCPSTDPLNPSASYSRGHGIVVLRDEQDRWAASRPVWNQHAYSVTNVDDRGQIPASAQVASNWKDPALNNFRQNVQGNLEALGVPDLTVGVAQISCSGSTATVQVPVCNRGTLPLAAGTVVSFRKDGAEGVALCQEPLSQTLASGQCVNLTCSMLAAPPGLDLYVIADAESGARECHEGNNVTVVQGVACQ